MNNYDFITRSRPIAEQVQDPLRERIRRQLFARGTHATRKNAWRELRVSRATVRTALAALTAEGLVRRRQGDGTTLTPNVLEITVRASEAWNIEQQIRKGAARHPTKCWSRGSELPCFRKARDWAWAAENRCTLSAALRR
jgi:DNA-binding GntR family transcriptional regulator